MKLMEPLLNKGYNVTCDNFFTSLKLAKLLLEKKTSLVGTIRENRREIPQEAKQKLKLNETKIFKEISTQATLTIYQAKTNRSVKILSTLHSNVKVCQTNPKNKPETILFYNTTKFGVDVVDQMTRCYPIRSPTRRWTISVFYNILELAVINSWILYKKTCLSSISRREFIEKLVVELTNANLHAISRKRPKIDSSNKDKEKKSFHVVKNATYVKKKQCYTGVCNRNKTTELCGKCMNPVCGKCSIKTCIACSDKI